MKKIIFLTGLVICCLLSGCFMSAGTLGGFELSMFPISKTRLVQAIDTLYVRNTGYRIPGKWKARDDWKERGYDFLDSRIFYFTSGPEEMYYVSFYGDANDTIQADTTRTGISVRAVAGSNSGWTLEADVSRAEKKRIEERFRKEIIARLEQYTVTKATQED